MTEVAGKHVEVLLTIWQMAKKKQMCISNKNLGGLTVVTRRPTKAKNKTEMSRSSSLLGRCIKQLYKGRKFKHGKDVKTCY